MRRIVIFWSVWLGLTACAPTQESTEHQSNTAQDHVHHESMDLASSSDQSLYQVKSQWETQTGQFLRLKDFAGKPTILAMVYASCKNACPRIIADMKRIQSDVDQKYPEQTQFVLVSIDPEVDTSERLAQLAQKSNLNGQWTLLRGSPEDVMELAALLGVKYRKTSETDYAHSNLISLLNAQGEIQHRQEGLGTDPEQILLALEKLYASP